MKDIVGLCVELDVHRATVVGAGRRPGRESNVTWRPAHFGTSTCWKTACPRCGCTTRAIIRTLPGRTRIGPALGRADATDSEPSLIGAV